MNFREKAVLLNAQGGVPFMEGREKAGELPMGSEVTIDDYGYIDGKDGEYVVLSLREFPKSFFFGGQVVTEKMQEIDKMFTSATEKNQQLAEGIPVVFEKKTNKAGKRDYVTCVFFPEEV